MLRILCRIINYIVQVMRFQCNIDVHFIVQDANWIKWNEESMIFHSYYLIVDHYGYDSCIYKKLTRKIFVIIIKKKKDY